ncbi:FAS1-like dehydratase domain-containing protein [Fodinicurvata sediminis]|uniref:FAS1-like dehydratase domain-containing protein n=1 Tax=Fodinicurvata sediminis TaxID=1121832 RepID=UPI0003B54EA7|nr:MaoC family dehydratase N-terminal domain-containing protein [Fodinicurvata sediminis]
MTDADLTAWIGRQERREDRIDANRANGLRATLESPDPLFREGDALPPLWHWTYFWDIAAQSELGPDGHPARGGFLPPVDLPRRMWAGGRLKWPGDLMVGGMAHRESTITSVQEKSGRSGRLVFVTVRHVISGDAGPAIEEEHDIVYREAPGKQEASPKPPAPPESPVRWQRRVETDATRLFRYSALTFNGHRIHYDHPYVTQDEGYPGLVVHGPMMATLMVELLRHSAPQRRVTGLDFRARSPVFAPASLGVFAADAEAAGAETERLETWVTGDAGALAMSGLAELG